MGKMHGFSIAAANLRSGPGFAQKRRFELGRI
jgi:hypothetical protein